MKVEKYHQFDVTIAGAGPSGSVLAYELAKQGVKVLLLEKHKLPRRKVCAGGITVRAASLLPLDISSVVEDTIYGARLSYNRIPKRVRRYDKPLAYMVMREKFDYLLTKRACEAGATLEDEHEIRDFEINKGNVLVKTNFETFSTPVLVGADGANSMVVQSLGLKQGYEYGLGINCHVKVNPGKLAEWDGLIGLDYGISGGYAWVFPKQDCLSIGAGGAFTVAKKLKPYVFELIKAYDLSDHNDQPVLGHLMPIRKATAPLVQQRVLLVGDAAGLIDPLTGEGIYYALKSSYLAAPTILRFLDGKTSDLSEYEQAVNRELAPELKIARTVQKMNSATPRIFFKYLTDNDRFWRAFCRMLRGERTYSSLKKSLSPPLRWLFEIF
jgi:geranylgeranyl reductase family protein